MRLVRRAFPVLALVAGLSGLGPSLAVASASPKSAAPAATDVQKLTFTNKEVDGKKVWLPQMAQVNHEGKVEITLINELADPHGFNIPGVMTEALVVPGKETRTVTIEAKKGEHKFVCHMHPAHVGGSITVQ